MSGLENRFRELCDGWALDALGEEELKEFHELLRDASPEMIRTCRELERAAMHLALSAEPEEPSSAVKARILAAVCAEKAPASGDWAARLLARLGLQRPRVVLTVTAILLALAVGLGLRVRALHRVAIHDDQRIVDLSDQLEEKERLLQVLQSKEVEFVILDGLDLNPQGFGKIIWDIENRVAVLQVANLPPVRDNASYQLWVYPKEGDPISAGTFAVLDPNRDAFFRLEGFTSLDKQAINGFVITLEVKGGASEPGDAWYLGGRFRHSPRPS